MPSKRLSSRRANLLLELARGAIESRLGIEPEPVAETNLDAEWLAEPAATFVTLEIGKALRGCMGSLEAHGSLRDDVVGNARAAAFEDSRFAALSSEELSEVKLEVSILSLPVTLDCSTEAEALDRLYPEIHGVILESGSHRATFLPQVWQSLPEPRRFLTALKRKAGLPEDFWSDDVRIRVYTVDKCSEGTAARPAQATR